jgi:hypothetical protein
MLVSTQHHRLFLALITMALLAFGLLAPALVLADAPITRGPEQSGQGGTGRPSTSANAWRGVRELPPPAILARVPAALPTLPPHRLEGQVDDATAWLGRQLNPGNWILDAGMGIFAGIIKMFGAMAQKGALAFVGPSVLPGGCDNAATNFVFCTPPSLTYDHPGVRVVWGVLGSVASGLVTVLFTVRLGRLIVEGPRSLATEGKSLILTFLVAMTFIQATGPICKLIVDFFNGLSQMLLARAAFQFPTADASGLDFGAVVLFLVLWAMILVLIVKSFTRLVQIIVLLAVAPLAGALLLDRSTSARFRAWLEKLLELLLAQVNLVIIFIVIAAILKPYDGQSSGDQFVAFLLSIVAIGMALSGRSAIGIASSALGGTGAGGLLAFLRYQVAGNAVRALGGGRRAQQSAAATGAGAVRGAARASGDPSESAAAQRQSLPPGAFRASDSRASQSNRSVAPQAGSPTKPADTPRQRARVRAGLMRERADALRAQGDRAGASALRRKAGLHERFAQGRSIAKPVRFTEAARVQRRAAHRQALAEVSGMHALERDALSEQIQSDEQRLPHVTRELAMASATGGDTKELHAEQAAMEARLTDGRARLRQITPPKGREHTSATRAAAAALANERLPVALRATRPAQQAATHNARQNAQVELARSRAAARTAAEKPERTRPKISDGRGGQYRRAEVRKPEPASVEEASAGARRSRAHSQTIALLRAQREQHSPDEDQDGQL